LHTMMPILFLDRDGTLIEEPHDETVDRLDKLRLVPGVIPALIKLRDAGYRFVMVTNQDGLGTARFPHEAFQGPHDFLIDLLSSQGIEFDGILICPHYEADECDCRKPKTRLVDDYLKDVAMDPARSAVIGDRLTDLELARRLGVAGLRVAPAESPDFGWPAIARCLTERHRIARVSRKTKETDIEVRVDLDAEGEALIRTGVGFFDHMLEQIARHAGIRLELTCRGDLNVDEHHTVEASALAFGTALREALGTKQGIARYGFLLPMDEAAAQVALDLSGRPHFQFTGQFPREAVGGLPTELVPHFFKSLADALGAALHLEVQGENTHHMVEACFKGVGRTLRQAIRREGTERPSTQGVL
jgi:imidazoleglycerol-phosphate dehydratase / histidinol-phosphatase